MHTTTQTLAAFDPANDTINYHSVFQDIDIDFDLETNNKPNLFTLMTDVQKLIIMNLDPQEIKTLYETYEETNFMLYELTKHTNFIVDCKRIMTNEELIWFETHNIKLKLLETYEIKNGDQYWYLNGVLHRDHDLPAVIYANGDQFWYKYGKLHRDFDLPAAIYSNGDQFWFKNNLQHRDNDLHAVILSNGLKFWYINGRRYHPS